MIAIHRTHSLPDDVVENMHRAGAEIDTEQIRSLIDRGILGVYAAHDNGSVLGYCIVKVDIAFDCSRELCIVYTASTSKAFNKTCFLVYDFLGVLLNCRTIRIHSTEPAIDRAIEKSGYKKAETVYKKHIKK